MTQPVKRRVLYLSRRLMEQADHLREQGRYREAERHYQQALRLLEGTILQRSELAATILSELGTLYMQMCCWQEAERVMNRALTILQSQPGPSPPRLATVQRKLDELAGSQSQIDDTDAEEMT